ncbi:inverse autotransporter beta domain-containing protein [Planctomicrobium sp. SH664]|uniref:inverse autotransporter beta domain-containing protein n=1 Tax=Planctomicrobium sp. SH664 TaxID=3448125 RepID=UPI003F5C2C13
MRRFVVAAVLLLTAARGVTAQDVRGSRPVDGGWKPRNYPELLEIMQTGYEEAGYLAPPSTLPPSQGSRPVRPPEMAPMPEIPRIPPPIPEALDFGAVHTSSSKPLPISEQKTLTPTFDQTPTEHDSTPWSGETAAFDAALVDTGTSYGTDSILCDGLNGAWEPGGFSDCETVPDGKFVPFGVFGGRANTDRAMGTAELFWPFWQQEDRLVFADVRGYFDDDGGGEGNFGLGYRGFIDPRWIFGAYVYYDVLNSQFDHTFHQATLGVELLSLDWDLRLNGYFPTSSSKNVPVRNNTSYGTIIAHNFQERAYGGFDAEVGKRVLHWGWNDCYQVYWFWGGYFFDGNSSNFESFGGPRTRVELRVYDLEWLGAQSRLEFGLETSYDRVHDGQIGGFARIRIPFGFKQPRDRIDPLRRRLVDQPIHDFD